MARIQIHTLILPMLVYLLARQRTKPIEDTVPLDEYDYIIVGGGTAGSLLANRLSEDDSIKVLLVEAGRKDNVTTEVPSLAIMLQETEYDWMYRTTPQEHGCQATNNKQCPLASGKVIGGSSSMSFMSESRGDKASYDSWKQEDGEWSFENLLPYFKKYEDDRTKGDCSESESHGCGGEITYTSPSTLPNVSQAFIKSLKENGFKETDFLAGSITGQTYSEGVYPIRNGIRLSAANAFLKTIQGRANIHISLNTFVTKVLIDPETKQAIGVELERQGEPGPRQVKATKEVILSAGTFRSPQILTLSGIGPKEDLEKLEIPVIADVPGVGQNLQDVQSSVFGIRATRALLQEELELLGRTAITQWAKGLGPMASPAGLDVLAYLKTSYAENDIPDVSLLFQSLPLLSVSSYFFKVMSGITDEAWEEVFEPLVDHPSGFVHILLHRPKSKGYVKVVSKDPHVHPEIDPKYFSVESDVNRLAEGMDAAENLINHDAFKDLQFFNANLTISACKEHKPSSNEFHRCMVRQVNFSKWAYCCTNKMGPETDSTTVVDSRLRVKGVKKLRVVDASIMPELPGGFQTSLVYAIAEKAADMIKQDNK